METNPVRSQLISDQRSSRASVVRLVEHAAAAMGSAQGWVMQGNSGCLLATGAVEQAAVLGANAVSGATEMLAAQPTTAMLVVSQSDSALLLLDAGGSSVLLARTLQGSDAACAISHNTPSAADAYCRGTFQRATCPALTGSLLA